MYLELFNNWILFSCFLTTPESLDHKTATSFSQDSIERHFVTLTKNLPGMKARALKMHPIIHCDSSSLNFNLIAFIFKNQLLLIYFSTS